jgi:acyl carrier protein
MNNRKWDSLAKITMVAAIEAEFGASFATQEYERFTSFESIKILLEEKEL